MLVLNVCAAARVSAVALFKHAAAALHHLARASSDDGGGAADGDVAAAARWYLQRVCRESAVFRDYLACKYGKDFPW